MSVLAVITDNKEAIAFTKWGFQLARARKTSLVLIKAIVKDVDYDAVDINIEEETKEPLLQTIIDTLKEEIRVSEDITANPHYEYQDEETISEEMWKTPEFTIKSVVGRDLESPVLKLVDVDKASLLLLGRHQAMKNDTHFTDDLYEKVHCNTMIIRLGNTEAKKFSKILIPCAGGPNCKDALKEGSRLSKAQGTNVTPLTIQTEGEFSYEVGKSELSTLLNQCGVRENNLITPRVEVTDDVVSGIAKVAEEGFDLVIVGASEMGNIRQKLFGKLPDSLMQADPSNSIAIYRTRKSYIEKLTDKFEYWCNITIPQLTREDRINLHNNLHVNSNWNFDFVSLIALSTAIASLGLISNSSAVVIGAMLIAPLMLPILGAGLAIIQGNMPLILNSIKSIILGFLTALIIGFVCGLFAPMQTLTNEIAARGEPRMADLLIALFSGIAAAHCMSRPKLSAALPGVAIAAALVPPIASAGISLAHGNGGMAQGAALLFLTNVICIILGSAIAFYAAGIRPQNKSNNARIWARRAMTGLILTTIILVYPLSAKLIDRIKDVVLRHQLISDKQIKEICHPLLVSCGIKSIGMPEFKQQLDDIIQITLPISCTSLPTHQNIQILEKILSEKMKKNIDVRIIPSIIID
ncbi:MAG: TIGR00341 family protein [Lentisphaeraceae bacterium]|nr:TIGR00341 family protein [Lentisphaeraceae bacterium]